MQVISSIGALRSARAGLAGPVGVVPTMGALHAGHLSLVEAARADCRSTIVTIFINPLQFTPGSDFDRYPRDLPADLALLEHAGVDVVFTPTPDLMYPPGFQTTVHVAGVSQELEGAQRPGHFDGVATVLTKLFHLTAPDYAYFGQKDAQQVVVVRRMARDLNFPLEVVVCPTTREPDGLAMSSRNRYLSPQHREQAAAIYAALCAAAMLYDRGEREATALRQAVSDRLSAIPGAELEYVALSDPRTLAAIDGALTGPALLSLTLRLGATRLLDNLLLPAHLNTQPGLTATLGA